MKRAPRGFTYADCPGCHEAPATYYPKGGVCTDCAGFLRLKRYQSKNPTDKTEAGYRFAERAHWLPYLYSGRELQDLFLTVFLASGTRCRYEDTEADFLDRQDSNQLYLTMPRERAVALQNLFKGTQAALVRVYAEGKKDGSNLLGMLAAGEITADEFNRRTLGD
jgi:hypothetical protein